MCDGCKQLDEFLLDDGSDEDDPDIGYELPVMCDNCGMHVDDCVCK